MSTKRLYFEDPYRKEFQASVVERTDLKGRPAVVLDQTCFYPESGGQPADRGTLNGLSVVDVQERDGRILHVLEEPVESDRVIGILDWEVRFDHMQQHSGQHVLSQVFQELCEGETRSFHLGAEVSTLEIDLRTIDEDGVKKIEARANGIVFENREIKTYFVAADDVSGVPLRRPPKKEGEIRVVEVSDFDFSACGGTHPGRTGEIGLIKILKWDRIRDNLRFEFLCGGRAFRDYAGKHVLLRDIARQFNVGETGVLDYLEKLSAELKILRKDMRSAREELLAVEADRRIGQAEGKIISGCFEEKSPADLKTLALNIIKKGDYVVLFALDLPERSHFIFACSEGMGMDVRRLIPLVAPLVDGRGGGGPTLVELSGRAGAGLGEALNLATRSADEWLRQA